MKFKLLYKIDGPIVKLKCVRMDESLRSVEVIYSYNGFDISSSSYPDIHSDSLYLRGEDRSKDNKVCVKNFGSIGNAQRFIERLKECVESYKKHLQKQAEIPF